jgi:hypothetical protein
VRHRTLESFRADFGRLPSDRQVLFLNVLRIFVLPAIAVASGIDTVPWPERVPVRRLANSTIYAITWLRGAPEGRATFHADASIDGEPLLVWRHIGTPSRPALLM